MASWLVEVTVDGPEDETGLAVRPAIVAEPGESSKGVCVDAALQPTDLTRVCQQIWVDTLGRRFGLYKRKAPSGAAEDGVRESGRKQRKAPRPGTMAAVTDGCRKARDAQVARSTSAPDASRDKTIIKGVSRKWLTEAPSSRRTRLSPKLRQFASTTKQKREANKACLFERMQRETKKKASIPCGADDAGRQLPLELRQLCLRVVCDSSAFVRAGLVVRRAKEKKEE